MKNSYEFTNFNIIIEAFLNLLLLSKNLKVIMITKSTNTLGVKDALLYYKRAKDNIRAFAQTNPYYYCDLAY